MQQVGTNRTDIRWFWNRFMSGLKLPAGWQIDFFDGRLEAKAGEVFVRDGQGWSETCQMRIT